VFAVMLTVPAGGQERLVLLVMMDTGERLTVRESRIMFGVRNHLPWGKDFYACVAGRGAHYSPEKK
jgi:hypothetical protein